jgi:RNA polymerase sigma-70 factor (ECF subfamily)
MPTSRGPASDRWSSAVSRVLAGETDAYAEIVHGCQDSVRAALGGFARSAGELEDFCHKAFVETYFKLKDFDPRRGSFLPWFLTVARNGVLEELRRRKSEERRLHRYVERAAHEGSPFDGEEHARAALERCLGEFEKADADLVRARYREGHSCEEIASAIGKTAVATRKALQRLRERLRACVERRLHLFRESAS